MKRGYNFSYLFVSFIFIIILLIFVKAFASNSLTIVSPINKTYSIGIDILTSNLTQASISGGEKEINFNLSVGKLKTWI